MKGVFTLAGGLCTLLVCFLSAAKKTSAQSCNYFAGTAVTGESVNVDLCSISQASSQSMDFVYYLGNKRIVSQANCNTGAWTTFPERQVHRPQSEATQNMMDTVCSYLTYTSPQAPNVRTALVFAPPSNVRVSPNGEILCSIGQRTRINIYGETGSWYYTDACGESGVIHSSQIQF